MKFSKAMLASMLCLSIGLSGCGAKDTEEETAKSGVSVETAVAQKGEISTDYVYSGKIVPVNEVNVYSTIQGKVATKNCELGSVVKAGDVLFTMDTEALEINKKQLQASLEAADAGIAQAQVAVDSVDGAAYQMNVESLKTNLENAKNAYDNTKTTYENNKVLFEQGIISKTDMDKTELAYNQAKNAYEAAKTSYDLTTGDLLKENKKTAQAALNSATASKASIYAQIESIDKSLRDAVVTAPIAGTVTACNVKASEVLSSAAIPVTITDTSKLKINVNVSQRIINSVHVGDSVTVKTETLSSTIAGTVTTVNAAANSNGTYEVEIQIANASDRIKPGMFAEVTFVNEKGSSCIVVDRDTVITKNGETYVFVDENGKAVKKIVETGIDDGKKIQITKGISVGDVIIVKGQNYVSEGDELSVANSDDSNNASVAPSTSSTSSNADNASSSKEGAESSADSSAKKGE